MTPTRAALAALALATAAASARADSGCSLALARTDARGIATYTAECRWPLAPRLVAAIVGEPRRIAEVSTSLES